MSKMVERVAKALRAVPECREDYWTDAHWQNLAKAAVAAMRSPTEDMIDAAYESVEMDDRWLIDDGQRWAKSWAAAIDAALQGHEVG
jgi:hypothetical protein